MRSLPTVMLALLVAGCAPPRAPSNVLVILVDALRADHLGCHGWPRPTSPRIDALASSGTRFATAVSHSPWTLPSMATLWTGLLPSVYDAVRPSDATALARDPDHFQPVTALGEGHTTLAEVLRAHGFATAAFTNGVYAGRVFGFGQGFEVFEDDTLPGPRFLVEGLLGWLDRTRPPRFLAYVHFMSVHSPWAAPAPPAGMPAAERERLGPAFAEERDTWASVDFDPGYAGRIDGSFLTLRTLARQGPPPPADLAHLVALYDRGIAYTDGWIGRLLDGLAARGRLADTLVVLTADHGDEFFEHGGIEHTRGHYEEVAHVPLVLHGPRIPAARVVDVPVGLVDVFPTVLDLLGIAVEGPVQGRSLVPLLRGGALPERPVILEGSQNPGLEGLRTATHKYLRAPLAPEQLFDLRADPEERRNLCAADHAPCVPFRAMLDRHVADTAALRARLGLPPARRVELPAALRDRLRGLGYAQ